MSTNWTDVASRASNPNISIVIPTFNRAHTLSYVLNAIAGQKYDLDNLEVIIVDDGSTDNTQAVVEEYRPRLHIKYFYLKRSKKNGVCRARNVGIQNACGSLLVFLDSDIVICPDYVAQIEADFSECNKIVVLGYVYCYASCTTNSNEDWSVDLKIKVNWSDIIQNITMFEEDKRLWDNREIAYQRVEDNLDELCAPWRLLWGNAFSIRKEEAVAVGMFDEEFDSYGSEDLEFSYRCYMKGMKYVLNRHAWAAHYPHEFNIEQNMMSTRLNRLKVLQKHPSPDIELYTVVGRYQFLRLWSRIKNLDPVCYLPDYSRDKNFNSMIKNWNIISDNSNIVIGCGTGEFLKKIPYSYATDLRQENVRIAKKVETVVEVKWALGVRLPFHDKMFKTAVLTDFWRALPIVCTIKIIMEIMRLTYLFMVICSEDYAPQSAGACTTWHGNTTLEKLIRRLRLDVVDRTENLMLIRSSGSTFVSSSSRVLLTNRLHKSESNRKILGSFNDATGD